MKKPRPKPAAHRVVTEKRYDKCEVRGFPGSRGLDEIVVGDPCWLHLERMSPGVWWIGIGDTMLYITVPRDATKPIGVMLYEKGNTYWDGTVPGAKPPKQRRVPRQKVKP